MGPPNWHLSVYLPVNRTQAYPIYFLWMINNNEKCTLPWRLTNPYKPRNNSRNIQKKEKRKKEKKKKNNNKSVGDIISSTVCSWALCRLETELSERWRAADTRTHNAAFSSVFQPLGFVAVVQLFVCLCVGHTLVPGLRHMVWRPRRRR
jgi:hypothetical protein